MIEQLPEERMREILEYWDNIHKADELKSTVDAQAQYIAKLEHIIRCLRDGNYGEEKGY